MPRNLALEILNNFQSTGTYPVFSFEISFQQKKGLPPRDRALVVHLVQGVLRWRKRLDWIIRQKIHFPFRKLDSTILNILRIAVYQIFFMEKIPISAAVNEAVKQAKRQRKPHLVGLVNGILREIVRDKERLRAPERNDNLVRYYSILYSYPEWLVQKWMHELGEKFAVQLMEAQNNIPPIVVRANRLKVTRDFLISALKEEGIEGVPTHYSPWGVMIKKLGKPIFELETYKKGMFQVQGEAAQISSTILNVRSGEYIIDVCAGLGGKATHMGELCSDQAVIVATDISHGNLRKLKGTAKRLGVHNIYPVVADATDEVKNLFRTSFRKIFVDAPCSGLGVISKHPDIKWTRKANDMERLSKLQEKILQTASKILADGGKMLYLTCTISREENEMLIESLLRSVSRLKLCNIREVMPEWGKDLVDEAGFFRTYPNIHGMEGFFGALISKE